MGRIASVVGPFPRPALALIAVVSVALAGCGGGHKGGTPATTTTTGSSVAASTTTGPVASSSTTTSSGATTTTGPVATTVKPGNGPSITSYTVSPAIPACNAPTMVQLQWTAVGATSVELAIDGQLFATYGGGPQNHLEYFACDRKPHTYLLTARAGSKTATASKVVTGTTSTS